MDNKYPPPKNVFVPCSRADCRTLRIEWKREMTFLMAFSLPAHSLSPPPRSQPWKLKWNSDSWPHANKQPWGGRILAQPLEIQNVQRYVRLKYTSVLWNYKFLEIITIIFYKYIWITVVLRLISFFDSFVCLI